MSINLNENPAPWMICPNEPITRRKSFALVIDANGETFNRARFFKNMLDWVWSEDQRELLIRTDHAIYRVALLDRQTLEDT